MRPFRTDRGPGFYLAALEYAQSLWRRGYPAQAILQLNRAWSADLRGDEPVLVEWPSPYRALGWILRERPEGRFLGNPVRHFQHLASRMHGVRREPRVWRAWAAFHLAEAVLGTAGFPRDEEQIAREGLRIPRWEEVMAGLAEHGWPGEGELVEVVAGGRG